MARKLLLAAGVFSLSLVGAPGSAQAESIDDGASEQRHSLTLFGKTLCLPQAPPDAVCDWRAPGAARAESAEPPRQVAGTSFALFGKRWCVGAGVEGPCDLRLPAPAADPEPPARSFRLLGTNICFADSVTPGCDLRLPRIGSERGEPRASL